MPIPREWNPLPEWNRYVWFRIVFSVMFGFATIPAFMIPLRVAGEVVKIQYPGMSYAFPTAYLSGWIIVISSGDKSISTAAALAIGKLNSLQNDGRAKTMKPAMSAKENFISHGSYLLLGEIFGRKK